MILKAAVIIALLQYEAHLTVSFPLRCATAIARPLQWSKVSKVPEVSAISLLVFAKHWKPLVPFRYYRFIAVSWLEFRR